MFILLLSTHKVLAKDKDLTGRNARFRFVLRINYEPYNSALILLKCSIVTAGLALGGCICFLVFAEQLNFN